MLRPIYNLQSESRDESNNKGKDGAVTAEEADGAAIEATTLEEDGAKEESVKCEPAVVYDYNQQQTTQVSEPPQKNSDHWLALRIMISYTTIKLINIYEVMYIWHFADLESFGQSNIQVGFYVVGEYVIL